MPSSNDKGKCLTIIEKGIGSKLASTVMPHLMLWGGLHWNTVSSSGLVPHLQKDRVEREKDKKGATEMI